MDEHRAPGQRYAPLCCGVDAPASTQEKPGTLPARTISDPTETVLRLFARCAKQASAQSWIPPAVDAGRIEPAHGPPLSGAAAPIEGHWLTERELGSALALLSVLRL